MKVVIPYATDRLNGYELRHAIRSMVKHFKPLSGVVLIGDKPDWYIGEHIPFKDGHRKEWNIVDKVLQSPHDDFLYSNDDFFARQDFSTIPNYFSGPLSTVRVFGKYIGRVINTRTIYPDGLFYDIHTPMIINLTKYREANNIDRSKEYLCKSVYGNFIGGGEQMPDCKVRSGSSIPDLPFFSTNERTAILLKLHELYPEKSDYEASDNF